MNLERIRHALQPGSAIGPWPGLLLCCAVALAAHLAGLAQRAFGHQVIDAYVGAILIGIAIRTFAQPGRRFDKGIDFSARTLLEIGVALLGASIGYGLVPGLSLGLVFGAMAIVAMGMGLSFTIGRALGLSKNLAIMVACGSSICGNSAIAAVAPAIRAEPPEVTSTIAFTAIWGLPLAILYPFLFDALGLTAVQYGAFAGLTIYSVPQVLAATMPIGAVATQIGTFTKLVRVMMLAPVLLAVSLANARSRNVRVTLPWFIYAFLGLVALRSLGLIPDEPRAWLLGTSNLLTLVAMAALGLSADARVLIRSGSRVSLAALASMLLIGGMGYAVVRLVG
jgi:uncharacterized integral membrane protein (TIGR00698 family)